MAGSFLTSNGVKVKMSEWAKAKMEKHVFCDHESETSITLSPWTIEYDFTCKKCRAKKIKGVSIGTYLTNTTRGFRPNFKPYKPPKSDEEKKRHWWKRLK